MSMTKVLFIGNSYTMFNNLPDIFREISVSAGKEVETAIVASGGKSLEWHWYNPETLDTIDKGGWDYVVLQDQSTQGVEKPDKLVSAAQKLNTRIRKAGAVPVMYATWARQHIPEMQETITETYMHAAKEIDAKIAPVGEVWKKLFADSPDIQLHTPDRSHPNILGSYTAACVFYAVIFNETCVGLSNEFKQIDTVKAVVEKDTADLIQKTAWETVGKF